MGTIVCRSISYMRLPAGEAVALPRYGEPLAGLLYLHGGSGVLTGPSRRPRLLQAGLPETYPAGEAHRLEAREDVSVLLAAFSVPDGARAPYQLPEEGRRLLLSQLDALAALTEGSCAPAEAPPDGSDGVPGYVRAARRIMDECYREELTLEELAMRVGRSRYHLSHMFRACYQVTPGAYLASVRLARAEALLTGTSLPVREVGRQVGFANGAYFTSLFKRRFGVPPREYRALKRKK